MPDVPPLVLTLLLDPGSQARFERLRQAHFPADRNLVPAHVSLFHALPGDAEPAIRLAMDAVARATPAPPVRITGLRTLGRGVAYALDIPGLAAMRRALAAPVADRLTAQDAAQVAPHVTVQNKVTPAAARALLAHLAAGFTPATARAEALLLWRYLGGPWSPAYRADFAAQSSSPGGGAA